MEEAEPTRIVEEGKEGLRVMHFDEIEDPYTIKEGDSVILCINDEKYTFVDIKADA